MCVCGGGGGGGAGAEEMVVMIKKKKLRQCVVINPIALRKAKIVLNFGLPECSRVNWLAK